MSLTAKQYKQMWLSFKYKNKPLTKYKIWGFQKSILNSLEEIDLCGEFRLKLPSSDPRAFVIQESDREYKIAPLE